MNTNKLEIPNEWQFNHEKTKIVRSFPLKSYFKGLNFLQVIGWLAQKNNHHPDISLSFSELKIELTTHDKGNSVTEKDIQLAKLINEQWF